MASEQGMRQPSRAPQPHTSAARRPARRKKRRSPAQRGLLRELILSILALIAIGSLIYYLTQDAQDAPAVNSLTQIESTEPAVIATEPNTVVHLVAAGDLNVTDTVLAQNQTADGGYNFHPAFLDLVPALAQADLAVLNFEGHLCGEPYGTETASAPIELAQALNQAGVDLVQTANSVSIRNGMLGLSETLANLRAAGLEPVGAYADSQEAKSGKGYVIREVNGLRIAFVAFTKGMDNLGLPEGSEGCVNLLYTDYATTYQKVDYDGIRQILRNVADAQPDYTIALLHWSSEYNDEISPTQHKIRNVMLEGGVDAIIGSHPHLVQQIDYNQEAGTLVAYSLGDFYGDGVESGSNYAILLNLEITRDNNTGMTTLTNYSYTPIYILKPEESASGSLRVTTIQQAMKLYETGFAGSVSDAAYEAMQRALDRIDERVKGE